MNKNNQAITAIKMLGIDAINEANSGHPGIVLGAATIGYTLFTKFLEAYPKKDKWENRDRFVLSAGHGSALLYALLHLSGYDVSIDDIKNFRKIGKTPGHPEYGYTSGVEATTGPLGQGIANAVGMAIAESHLAAKFNKEGFPVIDHYTYSICGDGDLQEGVALEAISLAGRLGLNKLIVLFDSNDIQLDGPVNLAYKIDHKKFFEAQGWQYLLVEEGHNEKEIEKAIKRAKKNEDKPTIIEVKTIIGKGSVTAGTSKSHGAPLGLEDRNNIAKDLNWNFEPFSVPQEVYDEYKKSVFNRGKRRYNAWNKMMKEYRFMYPELHEEFLSQFESKDMLDVDKLLKEVELKTEATRSIGGKVLGFINKENKKFIGGSADLHSSTQVKGVDGNYDIDHRIGRNINYGVREHAMAAINNGILLHGGLRSYSGAFFVFSDYMKPSIRLSALMGIPQIYVFTHDSIAVGEDGPTHQPVEQLVGLRTIPNLNVLRPADSREVIGAWKVAVEATNTPTAIVLTRQNVALLDESSIEDVAKGAYIVRNEEDKLDGIIIATGSEVELAIETADLLKDRGYDIRVVSMPSIELFKKQTKKYQRELLPGNVKTLGIEMANPLSLKQFTQNVIGIETFGASANASVVLEEYGFTKRQIFEQAYKIFYKK